MSRFLPILLVLCACAGSREQRYDLDEVRVQYDRDQASFRSAQVDVEARFPTPQRLDFEEAGTVLVDRVSIVGHPGRAFLRVVFTWINTGPGPVSTADLSLVLQDVSRGTEWCETLEMRVPYGRSLGRGSSYTSWFEIPTRGAHLRPGWDWQLELRAQALGSLAAK